MSIQLTADEIVELAGKLTPIISANVKHQDDVYILLIQMLLTSFGNSLPKEEAFFELSRINDLYLWSYEEVRKELLEGTL